MTAKDDRIGNWRIAVTIGRASSLPAPQIANNLEELRRIAQALHRLDYLRDSVRDLTDADRRRETKLEKRAADLASAIQCATIRDSDSRGAGLLLLLPDGASNTFSGEGWALA